MHFEGDENYASGLRQADIVSQHENAISLNIKEFENTTIPELKSALEHTWKYSMMGTRTMSLRDPVFTRRGDLVCELDLKEGESMRASSAPPPPTAPTKHG